MSGRDSGVYKDYSRIVGMDPAANFLLGPGWRAFSGGQRNPVLQFLLMPSAELIQSFARRKREDNWGGFLVLGDLAQGLTANDPITALTTRNFLDEQLAIGADSPFVTAKKELQLCLPLPPELVSTIPGARKVALAAPPVLPPRNWDDAAVVGIIDDGIAFGHERFRRADGTSRFEYFWHQDGVPRPPGIETVDSGREFGKAEIDQMLQACQTPGVGVDETKFYRMTGMADFRLAGHKSVAWRLAHGTHVLDLASGFPSSADVADRPLIGVQLPVSATANLSGAGLERSVVDAMKYIVDRAALLAPPKGEPPPIVINFSYGTYLGPHNGHALLERKMDHLIQHAPGPLRIVLPAGNSNMVRCHAVVSPAIGRMSELHVRVQPDSKALAAIQIWLPIEIGASTGASRVAIEVIAPDGASSGWVEEGARQDVLLPSGTSLVGAPSVPSFGRVSFHSSLFTQQGHFRIDIQPTAWDLPAGPTVLLALKAPAGVWRIVVNNQGLPAGTTLQAWIERSDLLYGYARRGRQGYFETAADVRFDREGRPITEDVSTSDPVRRTGMENAIGTGKRPMVLGGYDGKGLGIADYSAGGPSLASGATLQRPDGLAVTDDSRVHVGVRAAGSRSGSVKTMRGTSVAAPQVTRMIADALAADAASDRTALIARAAADEAGLSGTAPALPASRSGAGRLMLPPADKRPDRLWK